MMIRIRHLLLLIAATCSFGALKAQPFPVNALQVTGPDRNRIVMAVLGDGYRAQEMDTFRQDVKKVMEQLFNTTPFREYRNYFNVYAIEVPSKESGADHPGTASDVTEPAHPVKQADTYFGSTFDYFNIHRLLFPTDAFKISQVLLSHLPQYDQTMVVVNSPHYGGSGGTYSTTSTNGQAAEIAIHELGHSFAALADEYYAGDVYAGERANMTRETSPSLVRWKNWLNEQEVGIYQHCCGGQSAQWYKPHQGCKMQALGLPFCPVCQEALIDQIYRLVSPIDSFLPAEQELTFSGTPLPFSVMLQQPLESALQTRWLLNDRPVGGDSLQLTLSAGAFMEGENRLIFQVVDKTPLSRSYSFPQGYLFQVSWTIRADGTTSGGPVPGIDRLSYRVFPNPASDRLFVEYEAGRAMPELRLMLLDLNGRPLFSEATPVQPGRHSATFDLRHLPAGVYTAVLDLPDYRESFKVVVE